MSTTDSIDSHESVSNAAENQVSEPAEETKVVKKRGKRGSYRKYTLHQIESLIELVIEHGMTAKGAGLQVGINVRTAQYYVQQYTKDEQQRLPGPSKTRGGIHFKLGEEHTQILIRYFEQNPAATLQEARVSLCQQFDGLVITLSGLHKHLVDKCCLTLKKLDKLPAARNSERVIEARKQAIQAWLALPSFDYARDCVFIDEAGFNMHIKRTFGRSQKGTPARTTVPTQRGVSITILGAICAAGIINLSLRKPQAVASRKKRKLGSDKHEAVNGRVGTRSEHYLEFLNSVMDVLDQASLKGKYLVMDNAPIHSPRVIQETVQRRGYHCLYLLPYSPFLNPIEEFWSKVKAGVKRHALSAQDQLTPRILESARQVTVADCQGWIRHSVFFFPRCLNGEINL